MPRTQALLEVKSSALSPTAPRANVVSGLILLAALGPGAIVTLLTASPVGVIVAAVVGLLLMQSPKVAKQWEKAVVLRLGRFVGLKGPGLFWIMPLLDSVSAWVDQRIITTGFAAEQTLTSDT